MLLSIPVVLKRSRCREKAYKLEDVAFSICSSSAEFEANQPAIAEAVRGVRSKIKDKRAPNFRLDGDSSL